jgi:hypothetical protein
MHRQVHCTDVVPELAGRRSMSLVARSKKIMTSQLYVSQISHVAEEVRPRVMGLKLWSESGRSSPRAQREMWTMNPRALVGWSKAQSPSITRVVEEEHWSGGRGSSPQALLEWSRKNTGLVVEEAVPEH